MHEHIEPVANDEAREERPRAALAHVLQSTRQRVEGANRNVYAEEVARHPDGDGDLPHKLRKGERVNAYSTKETWSNISREVLFTNSSVQVFMITKTQQKKGAWCIKGAGHTRQPLHPYTPMIDETYLAVCRINTF